MKKSLSYLIVLLSTAANSLSADDTSQCVSIECNVRFIERSKVHPPLNSSFTATTGQVDSSNWSGYVAAPSLTHSSQGSVTNVSGSWVVPTLLPTSDTTYCAIWVGIDGYLDGSVEQIGTSHNWQNGRQKNYAWFEMYPSGSYEITGFPVNNGDQMSATVSYTGNNVFNLVIYNHTRGVYTEIPTSYTTSPNVQRSSAEWIVEAPYSSSILPLADFRMATFTNCSAIINGIQGPINSSHWMNDLIKMEGSGYFKAQPSALLNSGSSFQVTWDHQ